MLKVLSLFSGIGAFEKALENLGIKYDLVGFSEIDKYASASYCAIHGVDASKNLGDITKINESKLPKDIDLITYGFPCQDISLAGKQKGFTDEQGNRTRSGLFFDALRVIEGTKPKFAIAENVKNLTGKKFKEEFSAVLESLEDADYNNYWKVLNAKDYGIPQNRERVFIVSVRKDFDTGKFEFPKPFPLEKRLKDVLEETVDEKFYLSDAMIKGMQKTRFNSYRLEKKLQDPNSYCSTILSRFEGAPQCIQINPEQTGYLDRGFSSTITTQDEPKRIQQEPLNLKQQLCNQLVQSGLLKEFDMVNHSYTNGLCGKNPNSRQNLEDYIESTNGISPTLTTRPDVMGVMTADVINPLKDKTHYGWHFEQQVYDVNGITRTVKAGGGSGNIPKAITNAICVGGIGEKKSNGGKQWYQQDRVYQGDIALAHPASIPGGSYRYVVKEPMANLRIRKLTPKECWRLMGFTDADIEKAQSVGISNSQLYKQAGNSIVVPVLEGIFSNLILKREEK